jgi:hypothetical protein
VLFKEFLSTREIVLQYLQTIDVSQTSISKDAQQEGQTKFIYFCYKLFSTSTSSSRTSSPTA